MQDFEVLRVTHFTPGRNESFLHNLKGSINIYQLISILIGCLLEDDRGKKTENKEGGEELQREGERIAKN